MQKRENYINLTDKDGTSDKMFSAEAYELFKQSAHDIYSKHTDLQSTQTKKVSSTYLAKGDMVTEFSNIYKSG